MNLHPVFQPVSLNTSVPQQDFQNGRSFSRGPVDIPEDDGLDSQIFLPSGFPDLSSCNFKAWSAQKHVIKQQTPISLIL